jgi:hypothetical protein
MFFKKSKKSDLIKEIEKESERISALTLEEAIEEYEGAVNEYKEEINNQWDFSPQGYDENTAISSIRDEIHDLIIRLKQLNYEPDVNYLIKLDHTWQQWCIERTKIDLVQGHRYSSKEDFHKDWWWQIDRLDELTEEKRSTL